MSTCGRPSSSVGMSARTPLVTWGSPAGGRRHVPVQMAARCLPPLPCGPAPIRQATHRPVPSVRRRGCRPCPRCVGPIMARASRRSGSGIFPAGGQQAKVKLPALYLRVSAQQILSDEAGEAFLAQLSSAIAGGATGVVLGDDGSSDNGGASAGGGEIYRAAVALKDAIRGRASLVIVDRPDLAQAVSADGVLLTPRGVPLAVARKALKGDTVLVGRTAATPRESARFAADGASFVVFRTEGGNVPKVDELRRCKTEQRGGTIPVVTEIENILPSSLTAIRNLLDMGPDGIILEAAKLGQVAASCGTAAGAQASEAAQAIISRMEGAQRETKPSDRGTKAPGAQPTIGLGETRKDLVAEENLLLSRAAQFLEELMPDLKEVSLLKGAQQQLDDLFLIVVVGEYNSGKSAVINALLGDSFLEQGILPTTNEISILRYREQKQQRKERDSDGCVIRYLPAPLLQVVNVVDTPGTNVILERQQRLTEEYVPRADMVLFVLSADRPFTESEVKFLQYIRKWGKKVVFVVNKVDILSLGREVDEVQRFVGENARKLLSLSEVSVWPVSAKKALKAKRKRGNSAFGGLFREASNKSLQQDPEWQGSGFPELEEFITDFFTGESGAASTESVRLKLQTPVFVADALLDACRQQLENERAEAENDLKAVSAVRGYMENFLSEMKKDGEIQRINIKKALDAVVGRAEEFVDEALKLSNLTSLQTYLSKGKEMPSQASSLLQGFGTTVMGTAVDDVQQVMANHGAWLSRNCENQVENYRSFAAQCAGRVGLSLDDLTAAKPATASKILNGQVATASAVQSDADVEMSTESIGAVVDAIMETPEVGVELAERLMDVQLRNAVSGTAGTAVAAVGVGFVLTILLPDTSSDFLSIALSLLLGYVAVLNLPLQRGDVKGRVRRLGAELGQELNRRLQGELSTSLEDCNARVLQMVEPLEVAFEDEVARIEAAESQRSGLYEELEGMKRRIASME